MTTTRKPRTRKPRQKPFRSLRWFRNTDPRAHVTGAVEITVGKKTDLYVVSANTTPQEGHEFHFAKLLGGWEGYDVFCSASGPASDSCTCDGSTKWGHCKHRDALRKLITERRI